MQLWFDTAPAVNHLLHLLADAHGFFNPQLMTNMRD